jgi:hypothetical protein
VDNLAALSALDLAKMIDGAIAPSAPASNDFVAEGLLSRTRQAAFDTLVAAHRGAI